MSGRAVKRSRARGGAHGHEDVAMAPASPPDLSISGRGGPGNGHGRPMPIAPPNGVGIRPTFCYWDGSGKECPTRPDQTSPARPDGRGSGPDVAEGDRATQPAGRPARPAGPA